MLTSQVKVTDELLLREVQYRGALQLSKLLQHYVYNPDYYTVVKSEVCEGIIDREIETVNLSEVANEIRVARSNGCVHLCVQAHWIMEGGKGDATITLVLDD
jgi:hypothetical protein